MKKDLNILLVCGSGASSGFMAANIRKAAKARDLQFTVAARSDSEIPNYVDEVDLIMVGPHMEFILEEVRDWIDEYPELKVELMKGDYYSHLDGEKALEHILELY